MPTGYTAEIEKGISFRKFVKSCARAFGAYIEFRDDPNDGEDVDTKLEISSYYLDRKIEKQFELDKVKEMTADEIVDKVNELFEESLNYRKEYLDGKKDLKRKYLEMLDKVNDWEPPTPDHDGLKRFMKEQLTQSIDFDCGGNYKPELYKILPPEEWRRKQIEDIEKDIGRFGDEYEKELTRHKEKIKWISDLNMSLPKE